MKKMLLLKIFFFLCFAALAQNRTVTGKITNNNGEPVPGATITAKGSRQSVSANQAGVFSISVSESVKVLIVSAIGMDDEEIMLGTNSSISVIMRVAEKNLEEVVVVGYGTQNSRRISSSISKLDGNSVRNLPVSSPLQALQGQIAGVNITSASSRPGSPIGVNIRGRTSITAGNSPLYVVDGVILNGNSTNLSLNQTAGQGIDILAGLNAEDIESYEVLKDAAAAAIYGSRGSNGVIIITTKRGSKSGKSVLNFSSYYGYQNLTKKVDLLNASEYRQMYNEARVNMGLTPVFTQSEIDAPPNNINWINEVLKTNSIVQNYNLSVQSAADKKTQFYSSLSYFKQEGPLLQGDFTRVSGRLNIEHNLNDYIKFGSNINLSRTLRNETPIDNSIYSPFVRANVARPDQPIYKADGSFAANDWNNPLHLFQPLNKVNLSNILNSTYFEIKPAKGFKFRSSVGVDYTILDQRRFDPPTSLSGAASNGSATSSYVNTQNYVLTQNLNYTTRLINNNLNIDANAVYEYQNFVQDENAVTGTDFPSAVTNYVVSAAKITAGRASWTGFALTSIIGRLNIDWKGKYLFSTSVRRDGSSKIPEKGRFGVFPAASVAWNVKSEDFMFSVKSISTLKLRMSYGLTGNQDGIGNFAARRLIGTGFNYNDQPGFALSAIGSPNLKWESTEQIDIGLDLGFWADRLKFTVDIYRKNTRDLLLNKPIPSTTGFRTILENIGNIVGEGVDFSVTSANISNKNFRWTTTVNAGYYQNKITKLYNDQPISGDFVTRHAVGQPLGSFFVIKALGVDPATGNMVFEDVDKNNVINAADRQFLGGPLPKLQGGIVNSVYYMGFDVNIFFQYALGQKIYNLNAQGLGGYESLGANVSATGSATNIFKEVYVNRWTPTNTNAKYPKAIGGTAGNTNTQSSSRYLQNGSYGRLKNFTIGYSLSQTMLQKTKYITGLRFYVSAQNMLTFTKYRGYDPEAFSDFTVANYGVDQTSLPQMRTIMVGLQAQF